MNVLRFPSPCAFFFHCMFIVSSKGTIFIQKMIYGFFSLLSFYVFFFHLIYLTVTDYCSSLATQKLQFFCVFYFFLCYNDFSQDKRLNFLVFLSLLRRTQRLKLFCWV
ncbi:hypothetical protein GLYMA_14G163566v4 [Glycine max]|nr:hypothetical protein GLYMA_14G163566v4 [Glycine max]